MAQSMSMILHVLRFLRVGLIIIKDSHLNFDMKYQKISGNTGPYNLVIDMINQERSYLGSMQNRLAFTMSNLTSQTQNIEASRSSIQDTDFAADAADLAKNQILAQSAISQNILSLLR